MSVVELLGTKSSEYELLAEWHAERAPLGEQHLVACRATLVVAIVLRVVAQAVERDWREEADARARAGPNGLRQLFNSCCSAIGDAAARGLPPG